MAAPRTGLDVIALENLLRAQWLRLRGWVTELELADEHRPSALDGWTVAELVAHLGRAMGSLTGAQPAPPGTVPLTLAEYVGGYPDRAAEIAASTRETAAEIADDPLPAIDRMVEQAFAQLAVLRDLGADPVVQARRGPILLSELVVSRILELVVHGDDLARSAGRSLPGQSPLEPAAVTVVADTLLEILLDRGGWSVETVDPVAWIRLACGRVPLESAALSAALRPAHTGDSLPDLGRHLPLL
jgi:uncharacterized protein (TIGR03083 family)